MQISKVPSDPSLQIAADEISSWSLNNDTQLYPSKTKELLIDFSTKRTGFPDITIDGIAIERVNSAKMLGVSISDNLKWNEHVEQITCKASKRLYMLTRLKKAGVPSKDILTVYLSKIRSLLEYGCEAWHPGLTEYLDSDIENIQKRALRIIYSHGMPYETALQQAKLQTLRQRRDILCKRFVQKMMDPGHKLHHLLPPTRAIPYNLRRAKQYKGPGSKRKRTDGALVNWFLLHNN